MRPMRHVALTLTLMGMLPSAAAAGAPAKTQLEADAKKLFAKDLAGKKVTAVAEKEEGRLYNDIVDDVKVALFTQQLWVVYQGSLGESARVPVEITYEKVDGAWSLLEYATYVNEVELVKAPAKLPPQPPPPDAAKVTAELARAVAALGGEERVIQLELEGAPSFGWEPRQGEYYAYAVYYYRTSLRYGRPAGETSRIVTDCSGQPIAVYIKATTPQEWYALERQNWQVGYQIRGNLEQSIGRLRSWAVERCTTNTEKIELAFAKATLDDMRKMVHDNFVKERPGEEILELKLSEPECQSRGVVGTCESRGTIKFNGRDRRRGGLAQRECPITVTREARKPRPEEVAAARAVGSQLDPVAEDGFTYRTTVWISQACGLLGR